MNSTDENAVPGEVPEMHERKIELADGRYMIFFTFIEETTGESQSERSDITKENV